MRAVEHGPVHHQTQGGDLGGPGTQAQQAQLCLAEDAGGDLEDEGHDHIGCDVGQDILQHDPHQGVAGELTQVDMVPVAQGNNLGADASAGPGPACKAYDRCNNCGTGSKCRG